jgi:hypothetical protein
MYVRLPPDDWIDPIERPALSVPVVQPGEESGESSRDAAAPAVPAAGMADVPAAGGIAPALACVMACAGVADIAPADCAFITCAAAPPAAVGGVAVGLLGGAFDCISCAVLTWGAASPSLGSCIFAGSFGPSAPQADKAPVNATRPSKPTRGL